MRPEKTRLIHDLLDGEQVRRRETIWQAGRLVLRRRRWRHHALCGVAVTALALVAMLAFVAENKDAHESGKMAVGSVSAVPEVSARGLTDAELLDLFPKTPVGLITLKDGRKRLIFPRPGDEERFVSRL